jgi:hypothetical protein
VDFPGGLALFKTKLVLGILMLAGIAITTVWYYGINGAMQPETMSSPSFRPGVQQYPNPNYTNVTVTGEMKSLSVSPTCSISNPPCVMAGTSVYYIIVQGAYYRLIFPNSTVIPVSGSQIIVTGVYVVPSTFNANQWTPTLEFSGDIYVHSFSYVFPSY